MGWKRVGEATNEMAHLCPSSADREYQVSSGLNWRSRSGVAGRNASGAHLGHGTCLVSRFQGQFYHCDQGRH